MRKPATAIFGRLTLMSLGVVMALSGLHVRAEDGAKPGDAAMTCEQIAAELAPYAQQIMPNLQALGASQQQLYSSRARCTRSARWNMRSTPRWRLRERWILPGPRSGRTRWPSLPRRRRRRPKTTPSLAAGAAEPGAGRAARGAGQGARVRRSSQAADAARPGKALRQEVGRGKTLNLESPCGGLILPPHGLRIRRRSPD